VPREVRAPKPHVEEEVARSLSQHFTPAVIKAVAGRGSSVADCSPPASSAARLLHGERSDQKVQTAALGDPNGIPDKASPCSPGSGKLGRIRSAPGRGDGNGSGGAKGIRGTMPAPDLAMECAPGGQGEPQQRTWGQGQTAGFNEQQLTRGGPRQQPAEVGPANYTWEFYPNRIVYTEEARRLRRR